MKRTTVAVIGGGVAGLCVARSLVAAAVDVTVVEARDRLGGRVLTTNETGMPADDGFDLGPSWFWPAMQPAIADLVAELGLKTFAQNSSGDVIFERMSREAPQRFSPTMDNNQSLRILGGTGSLITALATSVPETSVLLETKVAAARLLANGVELTVQRGDRAAQSLTADIVVGAAPPRLLENSLSFEPALNEETAALWRSTPTWMAPHAKFFAIYDRPFWKANGLSGSAQSMVGPLAEIHDATTLSGKAALFGFLGMGAGQRASYGEEAVKQSCVNQLVKLFGSEARSTRATILKDWAVDPFTATPADLADGSHPVAGSRRWVSGPWEDKLLLAGSETSEIEPGYLAGAVEAANRTSAEILSKLTAQ